MTELFEGERIDEVNDSLKLIQKCGGLTFGTDALLLAGYAEERGALGLELGSGSGIISMLMLTRGKLISADALEVQEEYARLTERNAELNGLTSLSSLLCDVRDFKPKISYDTVFTNPPYMTVSSGKANALSKRTLQGMRLWVLCVTLLPARQEASNTAEAFLLYTARTGFRIYLRQCANIL